jgi:hypothetical protein
MQAGEPAGTQLAVVGRREDRSMVSYQMAVGVYEDHRSADAALGAFLDSSFDLRQLSVVGKEHHRDLSADAYCRSADRTLYSGKFGTFWVAGPLTAAVIHGLDATAPMAELDALGVGLFVQGVPLEAAAEYAAAVKADKYLLVVSGVDADVDRAAMFMVPGAAKVQMHTGRVPVPTT